MQDDSASTANRLRAEPPPSENMVWWLEIPSVTHCRVLIAEGSDASLQDAVDKLEQYDRENEAVHNTCQRITILPLLALATHNRGRTDEALAILGRAVALAEPGGFIRPFADLGAEMAALLQDALHRAALDADIGGWIGERLQLIHGDSGALLQQLAESQRPDVVYLDPMYPPGKPHVLVKKDIRALQALLGPDRDSDVLLEVALQYARRRVVVKRPNHAGWLGDRKPDTCIQSKKTRYDIYVTL